MIGAALEVHRELGPGYLESVYEEALAHELRLAGIPFARQPVIDVPYKGVAVGTGRVDMLVDSRLILELKAVEELNPLHAAQLRSYLRMLNLELGLLINFNTEHLRTGIKRVINL